MCDDTGLPGGDLTAVAAIVSVLSVLFNVCHAGYYLLWVMAGSRHGWVAAVTLSPLPPRRVGPGPIIRLACLPF